MTLPRACRLDRARVFLQCRVRLMSREALKVRLFRFIFLIVCVVLRSAVRGRGPRARTRVPLLHAVIILITAPTVKCVPLLPIPSIPNTHSPNIDPIPQCCIDAWRGLFRFQEYLICRKLGCGDVMKSADWGMCFCTRTTSPSPDLSPAFNPCSIYSL